MKTRNGFVSNSSSSSFVVGLPTRPKNWKALHITLFGDLVDRELRPEWIKPTDECYPTFVGSSFAVVQNMFNQIEDQDTVSDSLLAKICDPGKYLKFPYGEEQPKGKPISKAMLERYGIQSPYCISPTNRLWKKLCQLENKGRKAYHAEISKRRKAAWVKIAPKFKGLKKFVIMTQSDGGDEARNLAFLEYCWKEITKRVKNVKLTAH